VSRNFELFGPTGAVKYDTSDDLLNPTKGRAAQFDGIRPSRNHRIEPGRVPDSRHRQLLSRSVRRRQSGAGGPALRSPACSAARVDELPEDRLLYAGGGGSVRGYEFRSISPEDEDGDPIGGRSLVEGSVELRYRFLDDYGIVPFFDAGTVTETTIPSFDEKLQYAAGLGSAIYSTIGPIRADVRRAAQSARG
jgi:translocation and assembly module TamA